MKTNIELSALLGGNDDVILSDAATGSEESASVPDAIDKFFEDARVAASLHMPASAASQHVHNFAVESAPLDAAVANHYRKIAADAEKKISPPRRRRGSRQARERKNRRRDGLPKRRSRYRGTGKRRRNKNLRERSGMSEPRYSQPLPATPRHIGEGGVVFAGFTRDGQPGFVLRCGRREKEIRVEATRENRAQQHPAGFFQSLARIMFGGPR